MKTIIRAKKDLYNRGKCFTKGKMYEVNKQINCTASLMDLMTTNDMGEAHIIGGFWRYFEIVK